VYKLFASLRFLFVSATTLALAAGAAAAANTENVKYDLNIPYGFLVTALGEFTRQTGWQVESPDTAPAAKLVGPLKGSYTAAAALERLLADTGLVFKQKEHSFALSPRISMPNAPAKTQAYSVTQPRSTVMPTNESVVVSSPRRQMQAPGQMPSPEIVRDAKQIDLLGPSQIGNLAGTLSQQLFPMNRRANGAQFPEFRGLGIDTSTVTINGRRAPPTVGETTGTFDLGLVPVAATASMTVSLEPTDVQFGPPAPGGSVNIELKNRIARPTIEMQYGGAAGGSEERRLGIGTGVEKERFTGSIVWEHFDRAALFGLARDRWRNQDFRRFGGRDYRVGPDRASLNSYYSAMPEINQNSIVALGEFEVAERTALFGEILFTDRDVTQRFSPPVVSQILPAANPFNPLGRPTPVDALFANEPARQRDTQSELLRAVVGLKGAWQSWGWDVAAVSTRDDARVISSHDLDSQRLAQALAETDPERALNVIDPTYPGNRAVLDRLRAAPGSIHFQSDTTTVTGTLRGSFDIHQLEISAVLGSEWEQSDIFVSTWSPLRRTVSSAFAQFVVPFSHSTMLSLGSRLDRVSDVGTLSSPQLAFDWRPFTWLKAYTSLGKSERAPSPVDLFQPHWIAQTTVFDPARQQVNKVDVLVGGNSNLEPVMARTFAAGLLLEPDSTSLKKLGAKYWRIHLDDRITVPAISFLLGYEDLYRDRIGRGTPGEADLAAGRSGPLQLINMTRINGGPLDTQGVDLETSLAFDTRFGLVTTNLDLTLVDKYSSTELRGISSLNRVGIASSYGTIPRWHAIASIEWDRPFGTISTTLRHVPSYRDAYLELTGRTIPSQTLVDLRISVELDRVFTRISPLDGLKLSFGVENLFDEAPHFAEIGMAAGYDMSQGELRQRFTFLKMVYEF
jgi:iron complex outermembrane receptor protein